jgi:CheY-like chemotaxis protein
MNELPTLPGRSRLLVVDDAPINVKALYEALCDEHQVLVATRGAKALELCRKFQPDLVLLDVEMPDMTGHEAIVPLAPWRNACRASGIDAPPGITLPGGGGCQQERRRRPSC